MREETKNQLNGCGVGMDIFYEGKIISLKLALVESEAEFSWERAKGKKRELAFVDSSLFSHPKIIINNFYSGGKTGTGVGHHDLKRKIENESEAEKYTVITTNIEAIAEWMESEKDRINKEMEEEIQEKEERVKRINALPETFEIPELNMIIKRPLVSYNHKYSRQIQGIDSIYAIPKSQPTLITPYGARFYKGDYLTKSRSFQAKKFKEDYMERYLPNVTLSPKETAEIIRKAIAEVEQKIKSA